jgi:hypothetical protein
VMCVSIFDNSANCQIFQKQRTDDSNRWRSFGGGLVKFALGGF